MATLVSPGVSVSVTDESFYASVGTGTVPMFIIATGQDKTLTDGTTTAPYTTSAQAGNVALITSQRDLLNSYGDPTFKVTSGTPVHGHETNEWGLLAAYSFLGIASRAYVVRAGINTTELEASATEPKGPPNNGQVWLDTASTSWGIFEADSAGAWVSKTPTVLVAGEISGAAASAVPNNAISTVAALPVDSYAIVSLGSGGSTLAGWRYYKKTSSATWTEIRETDMQALGGVYAATNIYVDPHTNVPASPARYDVWIKMTSANAGMNVVMKSYSSTTAGWTTKTTPVLFSDDEANSPGRFGVGSQAYGTAIITAGDIASITVDDGGSGYSSGDLPTITLNGASNRTATATVDSSGKITAITVGGTADTGLVQGDITVYINGGATPAAGEIYIDAIDHDTGDPEMSVKTADGAGVWTAITPGTASGNLQSSPTALTGSTTDGTYWYDSTTLIGSFDMYIKATGLWIPKTISSVGTTAPTGPSNNDLWMDTTGGGLVFKMYDTGTSAWISRDSSDQSTPNGVVFADITETSSDSTNASIGATVITGGPNPALYPDGMLAMNLCRSSYNVRKYDTSLTTTWKWRSASGTAADGSGNFGRAAQRKVIVIAMQAALSDDDLRAETLSFNLITAPGYPECADEMSTLSTDRKETAFCVIDSPMRLANNATNISTWIDGTAAVENGEDGLVSPKNDKMGVYYPGVALTTNVDGYTVAQPMSHTIMRTLAYNDNVSYPWFAPAGIARGSVQNATNVGYIDSESEFKAVALTQGLRDTLYAKKVNPVANFPGEGVIVWGQKTLYAADSALDRINVSRLMIYLRERLDKIVRPFIFEPNDTLTRANIKDMIERFLGDIQAKRGLYDFAVVCDTSNNTSARIDRNELWIDIGVEPTKAAEFIYIPVRILNTGKLSGSS